MVSRGQYDLGQQLSQFDQVATLGGLVPEEKQVKGPCVSLRVGVEASFPQVAAAALLVHCHHPARLGVEKTRVDGAGI